MTSVSLDELTFGIELEVILPRTNCGDVGRHALADHFALVGLEARSELYNHNNRPHWKITTDGSIGHDNAEVVSPILRGEAGFEQVRQACATLESFGCRVDRRCGFHVHVGVAAFAEQVGFFKELVRTYSKFEPIIDTLVARSRRAQNNSYCGSVEFTDRVDSARNITEVLQAFGGNRFVKLNLHAYRAHETVEFRQHQGTTNATKVENWVRLCLRMVQHAAKNDEMSRASPMRPITRSRDERLRNLSQAPYVRGEDIPRFIRQNWRTLDDLEIIHVIEHTPRRAGTAGRENHDVHNVYARERIQRATDGRTVTRGCTLSAYHHHGGLRTHLAWDVEHGYVRVVNRSLAPLMTVGAAEEAGSTGGIGTQVAATAPRFTATIDAPSTLDGLLDLIGAAERERAFFIERQMELSDR